MIRLLKFRRAMAQFVSATVLFGGAAVMLSACNTTAGAGKDISATGRAVTRGANDAK